MIRFLTVSMLSGIIHSVLALPTAGQQSSDEPVPYEIGTGSWRYPETAFRITNSSNQDVPISKISFSLSDLRIDTTPRPMFELMSFHDTFMLKVTDLGWGNFECPPITLAPAQLLQAKGLCSGAFKIPALSRIEEGQRSEAYCFQRHRKDHEPFGLWAYGLFGKTVEDDRPGQLYHYSRNIDEAFQVEYPQPEDHYYDGEPFRSKNDPDKSIVKVYADASFGNVPLHFRRLQPIPLSTEERFLDRIMASHLSGGVTQGVALSFGDVSEFNVGGAVGSPPYGIVVDFRGSKDDSIDVPTDGLTVPAGSNLTMLLQIITEKSCAFRLQYQPHTTGGALPIRTLPIDKKKTLNAVVPRAYEMGYGETKLVIRESCKQSVVEQAIQQAARDGLLFSGGKTHASRFQQNRRFREMLQLCSTVYKYRKSLGGLLDRVEDFYASSFQELETNDKWEEMTDGYELGTHDWKENLRVCYSILCRRRPDQASKLAIEYYNAGCTELLSVALSVANARRFVVSNRNAIDRKALDHKWRELSTRSYVYAPPELVFLASILGVENWAPLSQMDTSMFPAVGFACRYNKSKSLRTVITKALIELAKPNESTADNDVAPTPPRAISGLLDSLTFCQQTGFEHVVAEVIKAKKEDPASTEILLSGLRYLKATRYRGVEIYQALVTCPFSSEVREVSRDLLVSRH